MSGPRIEELPERRVAVKHHRGTFEDLDNTRRPLYQQLIQYEAVGGPSMVRVHDDGSLDVLVQAAPGFEGEDDVGLEHLPGGPYAVLDYEGPAAGLEAARRRLREWAQAQGHDPAGPLLQVHLMDPIDDLLEQQFQLPLQE